jgi:hypothetical protein
MIKQSVSILCLFPLLIGPADAAEEKAANPQQTIEWVGKHRDEVIRLLGEPVKSKKSGKSEVLFFHGPLEWFAEPKDPDQLADQVVLKSGSEKPIRIGVNTKRVGASPADDHEIITDAEGNAVGAYGRVITAPGTGVVAIHRMKLFMDEKGYVYKVKIGKPVAK